MSSRITASYCPTYDADTTFCPVSSLIRRSIATNLQAFFFASPLKPGTVFHATLLLFFFAPAFSFHQERFSFRNSGVFWMGEGGRLSRWASFSAPRPPPPSSFGSHFSSSCSLCFLSFSKFFLSLVFTLFLACLLIPSHLNFFSPLWLALFAHPFPPNLIVLHSVMRKLCTLCCKKCSLIFSWLSLVFE